MTKHSPALDWFAGSGPWPIELQDWVFSDDPWPDFLVERVLSLEPDKALADELSWQVTERERKKLPMPPRLQEWFISHLTNGGTIRTSPPDRVAKDKLGVGLLQELCGLSKTEAIRIVATASGRERETVRVNVDRRPYKKK